MADACEIPDGWRKNCYDNKSDDEVAKLLWQYEQAGVMHLYRYGVFEQINEITRIVLAYPSTEQMKQLHDALAVVTRDFKHVERPALNSEKKDAPA